MCGSDTLFFLNAVSLGFKIVSSRLPVAYEYINENKLSIEWKIKRHFRYGLIYPFILQLSNKGIYVRAVTLFSAFASIFFSALLFLPTLIFFR